MTLSGLWGPGERKTSQSFPAPPGIRVLVTAHKQPPERFPCVAIAADTTAELTQLTGGAYRSFAATGVGRDATDGVSQVQAVDYYQHRTKLGLSENRGGF